MRESPESSSNVLRDVDGGLWRRWHEEAAYRPNDDHMALKPIHGTVRLPRMMRMSNRRGFYNSGGRPTTYPRRGRWSGGKRSDPGRIQYSR